MRKYKSTAEMTVPILYGNNIDGETLRLPPYSLEQLTMLPQHSTVHEAALWQKTLDVVGKGPNFLEQNDDKKAAGGVNRQRTIDPDLTKWWASLGEEYTITEIIRAMQRDYETCGWGFLEVGRNVAGKVGRLYYVPAHTIRAHMDGHRFAQMRNGRFIWFKRWGDPLTQDIDFYAEGGAQSAVKLSLDEQASELLVFRSPNPESSWYGVPEYMSAIGWVVLNAALRDWNIKFFENQREPRHLIIISGLPDDVTQVTNDLEEVMKTAMRNPHRNIIIPIGGDAKVTIEKLSVENEGQFLKLADLVRGEILAAHRTPPDRLGIVRQTNLIGGSTSQIVNEVNSVYHIAVVQPRQDILSDRLENFVEVEYFHRPVTLPKTGKANIDFKDTSVDNEAADANIVALLAKNCIISLNEARARIGEDRLPRFKDMDFMQYMIQLGIIPTEMAGQGSGLPGGIHTNTQNPNMPNSSSMNAGPERGRPARAGNVHNPADNTTNVSKSEDSGVNWNQLSQEMVSKINEHTELLEEILYAKR